MKQNVGSWDRIARVVLAVILLALSFTGVLTGALQWIGIILAVVLLLTAAVSVCPIYMLLKLNTKKA